MVNMIEQDIAFFLMACKSEGRSPVTVEDYTRKLRIFAAYMGDMDTKDIQTIHIRKWMLELEGRMKLSSVGDYVRVVRRWFNWMAQEGIIEKSPAQSIKPPRGPTTIIQPLSLEQIQDMCSLCDGDATLGHSDSWLGLRNKAVLLVLLDTGMRRAELTRMQLPHIAQDVASIKIAAGKTHQERVVGLHPKTQKALLRYLIARRALQPQSDFVWLTREHNPIAPNSIWDIVKTLGKRAGIRNVRCSPHTFRHTAGTLALLNDATERDVQDMLGHKTQSMVRRYTATIGSERAAERHKEWSPVGNLRVK